MIKFEDIMFLYYQGDLQTKIYHVKLLYSSVYTGNKSVVSRESDFCILWKVSLNSGKVAWQEG
jgi:hypothetical protein